VGVGHRPKRLLVLGDEVLQADGALVPRVRAARHLPQPQYGLISGGDATALAAAGGIQGKYSGIHTHVGVSSWKTHLRAGVRLLSVMILQYPTCSFGFVHQPSARIREVKN
jgi:hypothetical protein